jgi:hypothetical protein
MIEHDDIKEAWDRIARTPDGLTVYRHLQRICMGRAPADAPDSALPRLEGRRNLAGDLMAYMAEGIADNDRACVTFAVAKPVAVDAGRPRGAGRRISAGTFIAGFTPDTPGPGGSTNGTGTGNAGGGAT